MVRCGGLFTNCLRRMMCTSKKVPEPPAPPAQQPQPAIPLQTQPQSIYHLIIKYVIEHINILPTEYLLLILKSDIIDLIYY